MRNNVKDYEAMLESANETARAYLDMEGGELLLTWTGELIRDLAAEGNVRSAAMTVQKLCETVDIEASWTADEGIEKAEKLAWLRLFSEALVDRVSAK